MNPPETASQHGDSPDVAPSPASTPARSIDAGTRWRSLPGISRLDSAIHALELWGNVAGAALLGALMVWVVVNVVSRNLFNHPFETHIDTSEMAQVIAVYLGLAYTHSTNGHVRMEYFVDRFGLRSYHWTEAITNLLALVIFGFMTVASWEAARLAADYGDLSYSARLPTWIARSAIPIGTALLCVRLAIRIVQHLAAALAGRDRGLVR